MVSLNVIEIVFLKNNFRYKCTKEKLGYCHIRIPCEWEGVISEYVCHIKKEHPESFYIIQQQGTFRWKLPEKGNQKDCGIIKQNADHYIFEMLYKDEPSTLYFSLEKVSESETTSVDGQYQFCLQTFSEKLIMNRHFSAKTSNLVTPITERPNVIVITQRTILNFLNRYRHLTWTLSVNSFKQNDVHLPSL